MGLLGSGSVTASTAASIIVGADGGAGSGLAALPLSGFTIEGIFGGTPSGRFNPGTPSIVGAPVGLGGGPPPVITPPGTGTGGGARPGIVVGRIFGRSGIVDAELGTMADG